MRSPCATPRSWTCASASSSDDAVAASSPRAGGAPAWPGEARAQRAARDVLHGEDARRLVDVVDGDDAGVAERGGHAALGEEAPARVGARRARELRVQDLERDVDAERLVGREVDGGRRAAPELAAQPVAQRRRALGRHQRLGGARGGRRRLGPQGARGARAPRRRRCRRRARAPSGARRRRARRPPRRARRTTRLTSAASSAGGGARRVVEGVERAARRLALPRRREGAREAEARAGVAGLALDERRAAPRRPPPCRRRARRARRRRASIGLARRRAPPSRDLEARGARRRAPRRDRRAGDRSPGPRGGRRRARAGRRGARGARRPRASSSARPARAGDGEREIERDRGRRATTSSRSRPESAAQHDGPAVGRRPGSGARSSRRGRARPRRAGRNGPATRAPATRTPPREPASSTKSPAGVGADHGVVARDARVAQRHLGERIAAERARARRRRAGRCRRRARAA